METAARLTRGLTLRNLNVDAPSYDCGSSWKVPSTPAAPGSASFTCSDAAVTHTNKEAQLRSDAVALRSSPPQDEGEISRFARLSFSDDNLAALRNTEDALSGAPLLSQQAQPCALVSTALSTPLQTQTKDSTAVPELLRTVPSHGVENCTGLRFGVPTCGRDLTEAFAGLLAGAALRVPSAPVKKRGPKVARPAQPAGMPFMERLESTGRVLAPLQPLLLGGACLGSADDHIILGSLNMDSAFGCAPEAISSPSYRLEGQMPRRSVRMGGIQQEPAPLLEEDAQAPVTPQFHATPKTDRHAIQTVFTPEQADEAFAEVQGATERARKFLGAQGTARVCHECGCRNTKQWRSSPYGGRNLCNIHGTKWSIVRRTGENAAAQYPGKAPSAIHHWMR